ncbi:MAG: SpoIIE family protein phosphatase [Myxococcota bacterium]|nr:SpoIIE family protein phosphatase [Myxococcota bacterium]
MAYLLVNDGPNKGTKYTLEEECVLGRSLDCQVQIQDLSVSRKHARISKVSHGYEVIDLGSGNGTFVNEIAVSRHLLKDKDIVRVSQLKLCYYEDQTESRIPIQGAVTMLHTRDSLEQNILQALDAREFNKDGAGVIKSSEDLAKASDRLKTIYAISQDISNILDIDDLLTEILERLFGEFDIAHTGFIMLHNDKTKSLETRALKRHPDYSDGEVTVSSTIINQVLGEKQAVLSRDAMADERFLAGKSVAAIGIRSMICAPLLWRGESLGVIYLDSFLFDAFRESDLELLHGISGQAALAIGNARLHERLMKQQRFEQDLKMAERIQQSFLPQKVPEAAGFSFCARYEPAFEVGGDFYDFIELPNDRLGLVVGDVSGKGVAAALYMAKMSRDLRYFALSESSPGRVLGWMNKMVLESGQDDIFVTMLYAVLEKQTGRLLIGNAGHMPVVVREPNGRRVRILDEIAGLPLGVMPEAEYEYEIYNMNRGDTVLLYSDGLVEAMSPNSEMFGIQSVQTSMLNARSKPIELVEDLLMDMEAHVSGAPQFDDTTLICVGRL